MIPDVRAETATTPAVADPFDTEAAERIAAATALLKQTSPGVKNFFSAFFQGASPEDVCHFAPDALVTLAEWIHAQTATRKAGEPLVILTESPVEPRNESVLVAVNDDMPFLLDSLIGEMSARGLRIHALFHPIMTVTRDAKGTRSDKGAAARESVIVLALDQIVEPELREEMIEGVKNVYRASALGRARLAQDARAVERDGGRPEAHTAAGRSREGGREHRVPGMAGRQPFHLPRQPRLFLPRRRRRASSIPSTHPVLAFSPIPAHASSAATKA